MKEHSVPQPSPERMAVVPGRPLVVGVVPGQPALVALTAAAWAEALGGVRLYVAYADGARGVNEEFPDGTVRHSSLDPDLSDDAWQRTEASITAFLDDLLSPRGADWQFRYLAGRADRALTHLARAVDASAIVVGAHQPTSGERILPVIERSVAVRLTRHQHRPVLVVPLRVVDWQAPMP